MRGRKSAAQKIRQKPRHPPRAVATTDDDARLASELASAVLDSHHSRRQQKQKQNRNSHSPRTRKPSQPQPLTLRLRGLVALPTALQAAAVGIGVFYAFGSALLLCLAVMLAVTSAALRHRQHPSPSPPPPSSSSSPPPPPSSTPDSTSDDAMLDCVSIAHLEHRLRRRTLRLEDCIHYALFKVLHVVETVNTVRRSMLDYNLTLSIAQQQQQQQQEQQQEQPSAAGHDLLQLVDTVEREKQQQLQQQTTAASTLVLEQQPQPQKQSQETAPKPTKKKKPVRKRRAVSVDTVFSSRVTIEEYTVLPERPSLYFQRQPTPTKTPVTGPSSSTSTNSSDGRKESWIVEAFTADSPVVVADTIATDALALSETAAVVVDDANEPEEPSCATLEPPISEEHNADDHTLVSTPKPTKKKKPRQRATSVEATSTAALAAKPPLRRRATSVEMPALPVIPEKRPLRRRATSVEVSALKPPITATADKKLKKKTKPDARVRVESVDENAATQGDTLSAKATTVHQPEPVLAISVSTTPTTTSVSSPEKARRRRNSRRPRQRRSTLSTSERPSAASYVDDIGVVPPAALAKSLVDKNQSLYVAEAAKVRALQEAQPPIETKAISNPEIRIMVDEVNTRVTRMHEALATNWAFLASLSEELLAAEAAAEATRQEAAAEAAKRKAAALLAADDSDSDGLDDADLVDTELRYSELEPEFEDDCYGDVDYDDHYYSYHAMSTPCL